MTDLHANKTFVEFYSEAQLLCSEWRHSVPRLGDYVEFNGLRREVRYVEWPIGSKGYGKETVRIALGLGSSHFTKTAP